jgi:hypothetical protein
VEVDDLMTGAPSQPVPHSEELYPCASCGGQGVWQAARQQLACRSCHTVIPLPPAPSEPVAGFPFISLLRDRPDSGRDWRPVPTQIRCTTCYAVTAYDAGIAAGHCEACGAPTLIPCDALGAPFSPHAILPFRVAPEDARQQFGEWMRSQRVLRRRKQGTSPDDFTAVYLPCWTFSAHYHCRWRGEKYVGKDDNRRLVPIDGTVDVDFTDVLVPASTTVKKLSWQKIEPFPMSELVPMDKRYLAGFAVETYSVNMWDAWDIAWAEMHEGARKELEWDAKGHVGELEEWPKWTDERCKHVLVPVYQATYHHRGKTYDLVMNGCTGKLYGLSPWDPIFDTLVLVLMIVVPIGLIAAAWWLLRLAVRWMAS